MVAAVARSCNYTLVTANISRFRNISSLRLENWMDNSVQIIDTSKPEIFLTGHNRSGILHEIAKALKDLGINIIEAVGKTRVNSNNPAAGFSMKISLPSSVNIKTVHSTLNSQLNLNINISSKDSDSPSNFSPISSEGQDNFNSRETSHSDYKIMIIKGKDRVGLIAAFTYPLYERKINIINFHATSLNQDGIFNICFILSRDPEQDWEQVRTEIQEVERDTTQVFYLV